MQAILPGAPWLIAHRSMLGVNQPYKITLNGQDYVLWQDEQGNVFALDNVCPHRQAPLSNGWICQKRNTIACPIHALEFDGEGRWHRNGEHSVRPIAKPLELTVIGDCIWTYGGYDAKQAIPDAIQKIAQTYEFVGITGERSIEADFLNSLWIYYDFDHQSGVHRDLFGIEKNKIIESETLGYSLRVMHEVTRSENSWQDLLKNPVLLTVPKVMNVAVSYAFPSLMMLQGQALIGDYVQVVVLYPESDRRTKLFELVFCKLDRLQFLQPFLKPLILKAITKAEDQDIAAVESLYPRQEARIKLPNDRIIAHMEKLYDGWGKDDRQKDHWEKDGAADWQKPPRNPFARSGTTLKEHTA